MLNKDGNREGDIASVAEMKGVLYMFIGRERELASLKEFYDLLAFDIFTLIYYNKANG